MKPALREPGVFFEVETEELSGASGAARRLFERGKQVESEGAFAEVAFVEFDAEHGFVEVLKLRESEFSRQQFKAHRLPAEFAAETRQSGVENCRVVEGEFGRLRDGKPAGVGGIGRGASLGVCELDESVVGDADDAFARVALYFTEGVKLFEENTGEAGFLGEFAPGSAVHGERGSGIFAGAGYGRQVLA